MPASPGCGRAVRPPAPAARGPPGHTSTCRRDRRAPGKRTAGASARRHRVRPGTSQARPGRRRSACRSCRRGRRCGERAVSPAWRTRREKVRWTVTRTRRAPAGETEKARCARVRAEPLALGSTGAQRRQGARMQGQLPALAELGVPHRQQALVPVEVVSVQPDGLAGAQAHGEHQPGQRLAGGGAQGRAHRAGRAHQGGDVCPGVQVRDSPARS
jgi:hypothetical protein